MSQWCGVTISAFLLTPLREGRPIFRRFTDCSYSISTHAPAGGATLQNGSGMSRRKHFYSRPCGRGDEEDSQAWTQGATFLLTPLREGRRNRRPQPAARQSISTHAPAGGATNSLEAVKLIQRIFLLTPLREGRHDWPATGDFELLFLLTPLREGRRPQFAWFRLVPIISTHAPAGGATIKAVDAAGKITQFLLTPLREGRHDDAE